MSGQPTACTAHPTPLRGDERARRGLMQECVRDGGDEHLERAGHGLPEADPTRWYLAFSKPKHEDIARTQLLNQGFEAYVPMFKKVAKSEPGGNGVAQVAHEPMFPRYVFFKPGRPGQSVSTARHTRGVTSLVAFGFVLATVNDEIVAAIRALESDREQASVADISPFQPGTRVRLREKGLQALEGLVVSVSSKRVTLLLEILGRQKELSVEHFKVELA